MDIGRGNRIECPNCYGKGCDLCDNGNITMTECPQKVANHAFKALPFFDMASKGHLPVAGGVYDQSKWFVEAYRLYTSDIETIKAES
jgi:hypothetical protein